MLEDLKVCRREWQLRIEDSNQTTPVAKSRFFSVDVIVKRTIFAIVDQVEVFLSCLEDLAILKSTS